MSLKAFHVVFVIVSILCCLGFGIWAIQDYAATGNGTNLGLGIGSFAGSVVLVWYGLWFLKKLKGWSYL